MEKAILLKYDSFSDASLLQLNNDAVYQGSQLVLTPKVAWMRGSAFYINSIYLPNRLSFSTYFIFNILADFNHGDGLTFTIQGQSNTALGPYGGALGYLGIRPSLAIEFDTARNAGYNDINANHAGIDLDGSLVSVASYDLALSGFTIANGGLYHVWIDYNNPALEVRINNAAVRPQDAILAANLDLTGSMVPCSIFVGFTAGTGSYGEQHSIVSWYFSDNYDPIDVINNTYIEAPKLIKVSIKSSNQVPTIAFTGETVFLEFTSKEEISNIGVTINNKNTAVVSLGQNNYQAAYTMTRYDIAGIVEFQINFLDTQGNPGTTVSCTTDKSEVRFTNTTRGVDWFF